MKEPSILVVNTSPLIHLAESGLLGLLQEAAASIYVPEPVAREIRAYGEDDPTALALESCFWLEVKPVDAIADEILSWNLGAGESSVIALARSSPGSMAIIDDLAGRRCAEAFDLPLRGTVGLVLAAKQTGRVECARIVVSVHPLTPATARGPILGADG